MRRASYPAWQTSWPNKCDKPCCQSAHCANIKCAVCFRSIVYPTQVREGPPLTRYTCSACLQEDSEPIDMHEQCWQASRENHWHDDWLQILPDGTHVSIRAPEAEASASPCSDDVPSGTILNRTVSSSLAGKSCPICCCAFSVGEVITQLRCLHGYHKSCIVALDRSFECPACKQSEKQEEEEDGQHGAVYVRASDGRCISVFPRLQDTFTVLKLKQDIAKEDGVDVSELRVFGAGRLLQDEEEVLRLPTEILRSLTLQ